MYLARTEDKNGNIHFFIRESYKDDRDLWRARDLFDLGDDPERFICYVEPRGFYLDPDLVDEIDRNATKFSYNDLESLFWPFLDPYIRTTLEGFSHGRSRGKKTYSRKRIDRNKEREQLREALSRIHPFDRRRILFLKFYQINLEPMIDEPFPFLKILLEKSRDEIEHTIGFMEQEIRPWEMRGYLYAIFDIPKRFSTRMSRFIPEAQELDLIDSYFLKELCALYRDKTYLDQGAMETDTRGLHPYLRKYLILYFDTFFASKGAGYIGGRFRTHGAYRSPRAARPEDTDYLDLMGISPEEFKTIDKDSLTRIFRKRAMELHPDKGGDHEKFILLEEAYQVLMRRKTW